MDRVLLVDGLGSVTRSGWRCKVVRCLLHVCCSIGVCSMDCFVTEFPWQNQIRFRLGRTGKIWNGPDLQSKETCGVAVHLVSVRTDRSMGSSTSLACHPESMRLLPGTLIMWKVLGRQSGIETAVSDGKCHVVDVLCSVHGRFNAHIDVSCHFSGGNVWITGVAQSMHRLTITKRSPDHANAPRNVDSHQRTACL